MVNWKEWKTYLFLSIPMFTGYITSFACKIEKDAGSKIRARPPPWIFGSVWPILYLFLGLSWVLLRGDNSHIIDILMTLNITGLNIWIAMYGCKKDKKNALYIILIVLLFALQIFGYAWTHNIMAAMLVTPFLVWILFATMLNYTEVNQEGEI